MYCLQINLLYCPNSKNLQVGLIAKTKGTGFEAGLGNKVIYISLAFGRSGQYSYTTIIFQVVKSY